MIKKIPVGQLKTGMYIHDLNCGWMDHPFLRNRFALEREDQLSKILQHGVREVYIDTERGLDVKDAPTNNEVKAELRQEMFNVAKEPPKTPRRVGMAEELKRARMVHREANEIMRNMMQDVRLGRQVHIEKVEPVVEKITDSILRNNDTLLSLCRVKHKDTYTFQHSVSVCALLVSFSRARGFEEKDIRYAGIGGMLHDLGKVRIPDHILNKPGKLTDEEFATIRTHVSESRRILESTQGVPDCAMQIAEEHHERFDGSGYLKGLKGEAISEMGQMAAICDVYDAITSDRCYHTGMPPTMALTKIFEWSKFHFNPALTQAFMRCIGIYPVGTLVRLESDRLGVVIEQNANHLLKPRVRVIFNTRRNTHVRIEDIDLAGNSGANERIVGYEAPEKWKLDPLSFV